eukprot:TRINITY_DN8078_c0_g2_i1.p1 TRINITY_DN8078_c0_g2~~TRINITY_DN8078_c0_g2_i1.p1  ORF type:complete len:178 (-),score=31.19 TRINITY_DN8078_c0_g2_i1:61-594(-)
MDGYIYLLGSKGNGISSHQVLSRIPRSALARLDFDQMQYLYEELHWNIYEPTATLASLFSPAVPETSLQYNSALKKWYFLNIPFLSNEVQILLSERIEGPYSRPVVIYRIPDGYPGVFFYAAKSHVELARDEKELVLSYMSNGSLEDLWLHLDVYVPQIIRVSINCNTTTFNPSPME